MSKGLATKAIAIELGVAIKTVENHKIRVFEKLGVRTQAQAITVAMSFGLTGKDSVRTGRRTGWSDPRDGARQVDRAGARPGRPDGRGPVAVVVVRGVPPSCR